MAPTTRKRYQGKTLNARTIQIIEAAEVLLGYKKGTLTIVQGSYNGGGVSASAGTHDGGGAVDLTAQDWVKKERVFRLLGCAAWRRPALRGVWSDHVHFIVDGDPTASSGAKYQVTAYRNRRNGLANNGPDTGYRMAVFPRFVYNGVKQRWVSVRKTQGYSQPVANRSYRKGLPFRKGRVWRHANVATVRVGDTEWLVSKNGIFYKKSDFKKYVKPVKIKLVKENKIYEVTANPSLLGLAKPGSGNARKASVKKGEKVTSVGYAKLANGEIWVKNIRGHWYSKKYLKERTTK